MRTQSASRCTALTLAAVLTCATLVAADKPPAQAGGSAEASVPVDPARWQEPAEMPPVVSDMEAGAYRKALAQAVKQVDMNAMQRPDDPLPPPKDVVELDSAWKPQAAYWHSNRRDPKWDQQMFVACDQFDSDPRLAQAALADAAHAGYKGWLLPALAARIAYNQWRFDDVLAFGSFALADAPADRKPVIARWMYSAAKADYKFEEALRLAASYPLTDKDELDRLHEAVRAYQLLHPAPRVDPLSVVGSVPAEGHEKITVIHVNGSVKSPRQTNEFKKSGKLLMEAPPNRMQLFAFGPRAANVDFTAHFRFHAKGGGNSGSDDRSLGFGLVDPADDGEEQCDVSLFSGGRALIAASGPDVGIKQFPPARWNKGGTIRIIALGPDVEVIIDGKRAYYGPVRAEARTRQLGFMVRTSGVSAEITDVIWKKIESKS